MVGHDNITLAWRVLFSGTRASLLHPATPGPPTPLPDKRDLTDLEEDFRELGIPLKCLPIDSNIHLSCVSTGTIELVWPDRPARSVSAVLHARGLFALLMTFEATLHRP